MSGFSGSALRFNDVTEPFWSGIEGAFGPDTNPSGLAPPGGGLETRLAEISLADGSA